MYTVVYSRNAIKSLRRLPDKKTAVLLKNAVDVLAEQPRRLGIVKLTGYGKAEYRYRVGQYRILFTIDDITRQIQIADIKRRTSQTYR